MSTLIPLGAEFYTWDGYQYTYYKKFLAFNMICLQYCTEPDCAWQVCGYHPWDQLVPIEEIF